MPKRKRDPDEKIRTRISRGYQVIVPSELRRRYEISVGDEVLWKLTKNGISVQLQKKPSLMDIVGIGCSGKRLNSVRLKKNIQKGEI